MSEANCSRETDIYKNMQRNLHTHTLGTHFSDRVFITKAVCHSPQNVKVLQVILTFYKTVQLRPEIPS